MVWNTHKKKLIKICAQLKNNKMQKSLINNFKKIVTRNKKSLTYLHKPNVIEWLCADQKFLQSLDSQKEKEFGMKLIKKQTNQWTTLVGEGILKELLILLNKNPKRISNPKIGSNNKKLLPDLETKNALYEIKSRMYNTTGTCGEKILGCPIKYAECKRLYKKNLYIVCMGYQEIEAEKDFELFQPKSDELKKLLEFYKSELGVEYIRATDLVKMIVNNKKMN